MAGTITPKLANVVMSRQIVKQLIIAERSNMVSAIRTCQALGLQNSFSYTSFFIFENYMVCSHAIMD